MSRRKRLSAVATTALVAAFPLFPLVADAAPSPQAPATLISPNMRPTDSSNDVYDAETAFADFDVSLFEIPDGENAAFYRKRVADIQAEWSRCVLAYRERQREEARERGEKADDIDPGAVMLNAPLGKIAGGKESGGMSGAFVDAPADSVPARRAVALTDLYGRLANAAELPLEVRGKYYQNWLRAASAPLRDKSPQETREFYEKTLADEKAKSPLDLARVLYLSEQLAFLEAFSRPNEALLPTVARADVEKLLDVPEGESSEFYRKRNAELTSAYHSFARGPEKDEELAKRLDEALRTVDKLQSAALKTEAAAFDRDAVKRLLDVPPGESAAFYLERYQETEKVWKRVSQLSQRQEGRDLGRMEVRLRTEAIPEIHKRLAYADDLEPFERFQHLRTWLRSRDVAALRNALDAEIARDETSEVDALREPYVRWALLQKRVTTVATEARKALPEKERNSYGVNRFPSLAPEIQAELAALAAEIAERADDGALPWELGGSWSETAAGFASHIEREIHLDAAAPIYKEIYAALVDSDAETDQKVCRELKRKIGEAEFLGSTFEVPGLDLDGTPIDWKRFRGAPVLLTTGGDLRYYAPNADREFIPKCVEAGLQIVRYCNDLESARRLAQRDLEEQGNFRRRQAQGFPSLSAPTPIADYVVPLEGRGPGDWPSEHGIIWASFAVLFDADGRVLATYPRLLNKNNAPEIADELRKLFPDVPSTERE
ncbi:MAG: hypothetical protein IKW13_07595 [Thermoguttaceae bacterium]|nr:hypothetical protein [Thermoguttaceae bacterium]